MDLQTDNWKDKCTDGQTEIWMYRQTVGVMDKIQTDRERDV